MQVVQVQNISKTFGNLQAVYELSFEVEQGEIYGLLGPNGAGKTTTIRMLLNLFHPDQGAISILGGPMSEAKKTRIGYMPEERGLYQDIPLEHCLLHLATLKGLSDQEAHRSLSFWLERFDLLGCRRKKVKELSKGMQQKAQIISTLLHQPELVVMDEPFTALDPVNVQLVKDVLAELRQQGVTILMSTHQMQPVEELCDRILLINQGRGVLYGGVDEIRHRYSGHAVWVRAAGRLPEIRGVKEIHPHNNAMHLSLDENTTPQQVFQTLAASNVVLEKFEIAIPTLDEVFIRVVQEGNLL